MEEVRVVRPVYRWAGVWENPVSRRGMFPRSRYIQSLVVDRCGGEYERWERMVLLHVELVVRLRVMDYGRVLVRLVCMDKELFQQKGDRVPLRRSKGCNMNRHVRRVRGSEHDGVGRYGEQGHVNDVG